MRRASGRSWDEEDVRRLKVLLVDMNSWACECDNELCGNGQTDRGDWDDKRTAYTSLGGSPITCTKTEPTGCRQICGGGN